MCWWAMRVNENLGITNWDLGPHFRFWNADPENIQQIPVFSSPHVDVLPESQEIRAYARTKTLLRLVSGLSLILRECPVHSLNSFYYHKNERMKQIYENKNTTIAFQELINPFDTSVILKVKANMAPFYEFTPNRRTDYAELIVTDSLVREVILLLSLAFEEDLYLLVNTYKILETLRNDLEFKVKSGKLVPNKISEQYSFDNLFKLQQFTGYINNRGSSGILSRHGYTGKETQITAPSYDDIFDTLVKSIKEWLNYKCATIFKRIYS